MAGGAVLGVCERQVDAVDEWIDEAGVFGPDSLFEDSDELEDVFTARGLCRSDCGIASIEEAESCASVTGGRDMILNR